MIRPLAIFSILATLLMAALLIFARPGAAAGPGTIYGRAVMPDGTSGTGGMVQLFGPDYARVMEQSLPGNGYFTLTSVPNGVYLIRDNKPYAASQASSVPLTITVVDNAQTVELRTTTPVLTATVRDSATMAGVYSSVVWVEPQFGGVRQSARSITDGHVKYGGLLTGTYSVWANPPEDSPFSQYHRSQTITFYHQGGLTHTLDVVLLTNSITGTLVITDMTPVSDTTVTLLADKGGPLDSYTTDSQGRFKFGPIAAGTYYLYADPPDRPGFEGLATIFSPTTYVSGTTGIGYLMFPPAVIRGRVVLPGSGTPVSDTGVCLFTDGHSINTCQRTRDDGTFAFGGVPTGTYSIQAETPERPGYDSYAQSQIVPVTYSGPPVNVGDIALQAVAFYGHVLLPGSLTLVPDARVEFYNEFHSFHIGGQTDDTGYFKFGAPPTSGNYVMQAFAPESPAYLAFANSDPKPVTYTSGRPATNVGYLVLNPVQFSGYVRNPDLTAAAYVGVDIHNFDYSQRGNAGTGSDGSYRIGGMSPGQYAVQAHPSPQSPYAASVARPITIQTGVTQTLDLVLTRPSISGTVKHPDGSVAANAGGDVRYPDGRMIQGFGTQQDGQFKLGGLVTGTYVLMAYPSQQEEGLYGRSNPMTLSVGAGSTASVVLTLTIPSIRGSVCLPGGAPASRAGVSLHTTDFSFNDGTGTNDNGNYSFGGVPVGGYLIEIHPPWGQGNLIAPAAVPVTVSVGTTTVVAPICFETANKHLVGYVRSNTGDEVRGAEVHANRIDGSGNSSAIVTSTGAYSFTMNLAQGTWSVGIGPDKRPDATTPNWAWQGQPATIRFEGAGVETQTITFNVTTAGGSIFGRLLKPDGSTGYESHSVGVCFHSMAGIGNCAPVDSDGQFDVALPGGTFMMDANSWRGSWNYSAPSGLNYTIADGEDRYIGDIRLVGRDSRIVGRVLDDSDNGVISMEVRAWMHGGGGGGWTNTITDGVFAIDVISGTWDVEPNPSPTSGYTRSGQPQQASVADGGTQTVTLRVMATDARISGQVVNDANGAVLSDLYGYAFVESNTGSGPGGPIERGLFNINVRAGSYRVSAGFPPGVEYSLMRSVPVTVTSGSVISTQLRVRANDATITGTIRNINDQLQPGAEVDINAMNPAGAHRFTRADTGTATYEMGVISGTWHMGAWSPPGSGYVIRPRSDPNVTVWTGETAVWDLTAIQASAHITGTVRDNIGDPVQGAWVGADELINVSPGKNIHAGTQTDNNGRYRLDLPAGTYWVHAGAPPDLGLVSPHPVSLTLGVTETRHVDFQLRTADAAISGTVFRDGAPQEAFVWAWSESGGNAWSQASDGNFNLGVTGSDVWHIGANAKVYTNFYHSNDAIITTTGGIHTQNLTLTLAGHMPDAETASFDASAMQVINLSDGTQIHIPAGALAVSGTVTVRAMPKSDMPRERGLRPLGIGYTLSARDSLDRNITRFNTNVTIVFSYTDAQLAALGVSEADLVPSYWNGSAWQPVDNVMVDTDNNRVSIAVDHFTDFGLLASTAGGAIPTVAGPSIHGEVTYTGIVTGEHHVYVSLHQRLSEGPITWTERMGPGPYTLTDVAPGTYYVIANMDANDSGGLGGPDSADPLAAYNMGALVTVTSTDVNGINIALDDAPRGVVAGQVNPQGRTNKASVAIGLNGAPATLSLADGAFGLVPPAGTYVISTTLAGYLPAQGTLVVAAYTGTYTVTTRSAVSLLGGDTNNDGAISIYDLVAVGAAFGTSGGAADITGNGVVNIYDLVLVGGNFGRAGPINWP